MLDRRRAAGACIALLWAVWACAPGTPGPELSQAELLSRIEAGTAPLLVDVRSPEEFAAGHVPGAINIPHDRLDERVGELAQSRDREVVLYCESGRRAARANAILGEHGFVGLRHLSGDMSAWREAGLPTE